MKQSVNGTVNGVLGGRSKRIVVVGFGMVGIAFVEKLIQNDKRRQEYHIIVIGDEKHVAYNRVGLTSFFCTILFNATSINF